MKRLKKLNLNEMQDFQTISCKEQMVLKGGTDYDHTCTYPWGDDGDYSVVVRYNGSSCGTEITDYERILIDNSTGSAIMSRTDEQDRENGLEGRLDISQEACCMAF
ncbi:hypothetical protein FNH22_21045 [Fulvivirga sp. M361]|uniref:hypothetical protein n=1 Tax=Fulvivirga sp. M361 TaxID=2594266 RepID=UPI00117A53C1|nr:hypothetical protein [Fulvivirga sp. M361]TRX53384.1 hypothetical protein FNH22_21045 [Fulvivirga sp. M361]